MLNFIAVHRVAVVNLTAILVSQSAGLVKGSEEKNWYKSGPKERCKNTAFLAYVQRKQLTNDSSRE